MKSNQRKYFPNRRRIRAGAAAGQSKVEKWGSFWRVDRLRYHPADRSHRRFDLLLTTHFLPNILSMAVNRPLSLVATSHCSEFGFGTLMPHAASTPKAAPYPSVLPTRLSIT